MWGGGGALSSTLETITVEGSYDAKNIYMQFLSQLNNLFTHVFDFSFNITIKLN